MPQMPESDKTVLDLVDVVLESWKKEQIIETEDGERKVQRVIDERKAWWQTHHIGTYYLGRFALERENLGNLFKTAKFHMTSFRAEALKEQGLLLCEALDYSIDAKSSEALRDDHNTNQTLLAMLAKAKTEKAVTLKGDVQRSVLDGLLGREAQKATN